MKRYYMPYPENYHFLIEKMKNNNLEIDGFIKLPKMTDEDLAWLRDVIVENWRKRLIECYPEKEKRINNTKITRYHEIRNEVDHELLWGKKYRIFSDAQIKELQQQDFFINLKNIFGNFEIAEQTYDGVRQEGKEEVYWRLVSPNFLSDVGGVHADYWFHEAHKLNGVVDESVDKTLKAWIPIFCEPLKNGLLISRSSHNRRWDYRLESRFNIAYPVFNGNYSDLNLELVNTQPGEILVFGEHFMHGGAINNGFETRVSAEITMKFRKKLY